MKKKITLLLVLLLVLPMIFTGCQAYKAQKEADGGMIQKAGPYVVVDTSGGIIQNVWIMQNAFVISSTESDGWVFTDDRGINVKVGGDTAVFRDDERIIMKHYVEYHRLEEILEYPTYADKVKAHR